LAKRLEIKALVCKPASVMNCQLYESVTLGGGYATWFTHTYTNPSLANFQTYSFMSWSFSPAARQLKEGDRSSYKTGVSCDSAASPSQAYCMIASDPVA
jgi:hypothetical protein